MPHFAYLESAGGFALIGLAFWIWMIYHCATRELNTKDKILWLLLIICVPEIGALIYFFVRVVKIRG